MVRLPPPMPRQGWKALEMAPRVCARRGAVQKQILPRPCPAVHKKPTLDETIDTSSHPETEVDSAGPRLSIRILLRHSELCATHRKSGRPPNNQSSAAC